MPAQYKHSLHFNRDHCDGCMSCMRACPTAAVRIRGERAVKLADRCIDCGECIKVCPRGAIVPLTDQLADLSKFSYRVAIPSPVLYAQFDTELSPGIVTKALKQCGFDDVENFSPACDAVTMAIEIYLGEHRGQYPLISPFCPTVVRLIQVKYPDLVEQLLPVLAPREVAARNAKKRIADTTGMSPDRIGAVYITSCPGKMVAIMEHPGLDNSCLDTAVSISDLYQTLAAAVSSVDENGTDPSVGETATGLSWAYMGGLPHSLPAENTISVAGLPNVIRILDDIEKGRLRKYSYIECHACPEGCVGGCLSVEDPYVARAKAIRMGNRLPQGPAADKHEVERLYHQGYYLMDEALASRPLRPLDEDITRAIVKMKERDRIFNGLPGIDCGACGSPSCRAFAEDIVQQEAEQAACVFFHQRELADRIEDLARLVKMQQFRHGEQS